MDIRYFLGQGPKDLYEDPAGPGGDEEKMATAMRSQRRTAAVLVIAALIGLAAACSSKPAAQAALPEDFASGKPYFVRVPPRADWSRMIRAGHPPKNFALARKWGPFYDFRQTDLRQLDLADRADVLLRSFFDTETKWPGALPPEFDPAMVLEANRNPGFGIRAVHARGVTGKGVSVAVIDTPLLLDHEEYGDRLRFYGEVNAGQVEANFHGSLVTSILAGRACGVAPDAEIYYVGSHLISLKEDSGPDASYYAQAIETLLEVNARLPLERRIRVLSISAAWSHENPGFKAVNRAFRKAWAAGVFVVAGNIAVDIEPGMWFWGLDRRTLDDPDDPGVYSTIAWKNWIAQIAGRDGFERYYERRLRAAGTSAGTPEVLLVSEGPRTVAGPFGRASYGFYPLGGWSSILPQIAGLYALACEVKPDITPDVFWRAALATGDPMPVEAGWATYAGKRVNPARLIESLR